MKTQRRTDVVLEAIEQRLSDISERQHALAWERSYLLEQITPLPDGKLLVSGFLRSGG